MLSKGIRSARNLMVGIALSPLAALPADDVLQELQDRVAIEDLIIRYAWALDTLDADMYASVFAEDAEFEVGGRNYEGRAQIRAIVTRLKENRAVPRQAGDPEPSDLYHVVSNTVVDIVDSDEARHQSYYQTVRVGSGGQVVIGTMGRYDDVLVKRNGQWFIKSRKAINFTRP